MALPLIPINVLTEHSDELYLNPQFQKFFEQSANSLVIKADAPHFTVLAVSDQFLRLTGLKRGEVLGKDLFTILTLGINDPEICVAARAAAAQSMLKRTRVEWPDFSYIQVDYTEAGKLQYCRNYFEPIYGNDGIVTHLLNTTVDVTEAVSNAIEAKAAIQKLVDSEAGIRRMVNEAPVGMCILKNDPPFVEEINDYFVRLIGKPYDLLFKKSYWEVNPELEEMYKPIISSVFETGETYHARGRAVPLVRNGKEEVVYIDFVFHLMAGYDGIRNAILIIANDVTEQYQGHRNLENAYEQLRLSKQAAQLGTFDMDMATNEMLWDERTRLLFGITHDGPVDYLRDFVHGLHDEDRGRVLRIISDLIHNRIEDGRYDVEYRTISQQDGSVRWVRAIGKLYFDDHGKPFRFIGSVLDITDQKLDEQRKNDFIGMVSHELKTPLTSMLAYQQLLQKKLLKDGGDEFARVALAKSNQQIRKMTTMINGFLNISHLESGKIQLKKETFDLRVLLEELMEDFRMITSTHELILKACDHPMLYADREKISSVISNLISNAIKYSPQGKVILVSCNADQEHVEVQIKDEGMGIKTEDQAKLFQRFYRIATSHRENISGFGIGLYLSKEIVERHEGKIWVESEAAKGSTFSFSLPAQK